MRSYRNSLIVLTFIVAFAFANSSSAYAWPFGGQKKDAAPAKNKTTDQKTSATTKSASSTGTKAPASKASEKDSDAAVGVREDDAAIQALPKIPKTPKFPKAKDYNMNPDTVKVVKVSDYKGVQGTSQLPSKIEPEKYQTPVQGISVAKNISGANAAEDAEITKIQDQIKDIIKLNESLKTQYSGQSAEIQKIGEQAKIHQKILEDLQKGPAKAPSVKSDELIQLEKIRLIKKETEDNHRFIEKLKESNTNSQQQSTEKPTTQKAAF